MDGCPTVGYHGRTACRSGFDGSTVANNSLTKVEPVSHYARLFGFTVAILATIIVGPARAVTIATVPVGYAGNSPDPATGSLYGAVPYNYRIGIYDVTNAQYAEFLNAKAAPSDPYGLWNFSMDPSYPSTSPGAISRSGSVPYSYSVKPGYANKPVIYVSWYDAVRFVNWLQNGHGNGDTETGTYLITNGGPNSGTVLVPDATTRMAWASTNSFHWLLPSENEWYKAAYYNAVAASYFQYPFQSNAQPAGLAPPGNSNSGDFFNNGFPAYNYDGNGSYLTDAGAYPNSVSPFGSFDMGGDVFQWNEATFDMGRGYRGGWWGDDPSQSAASGSGYARPAYESEVVGFRVASVGTVPEPSTGVLAVLACGIVWIARRSVLRNDAAS
jgi:formylglycine-generating enzyme